MPGFLVYVLLFVVCAAILAVGLLLVGGALGPKRQSPVKQMPYESGMDPIHDARQRFDVRFHLVAIAFLVFDVELLFLYPWAVANRDPAGLPALAQQVPDFSVHVVFGEVMFFVALLAAGFAYAWRRGVFRWR
ncbi:MAG: NADH-quinone oxidoreductase subunit A [Pirellulaceae bacterium]